MIPYFEIHRLMVGPVPIQVWGLFVALGIVLAVVVAARLAAARGIARAHVYDTATIVVLAAFIGARLLHVTAYQWGYYQNHVLEIFAVWQGGLSSFGGFLGGAAAGLWLIRRRRLPLVPFIDVLLTALPLGWMVGRLGCFLIHDHPGTLTHSVFGVRYPGGARYDLGLIEAVIGGFVFSIGFAVYRQYGKKYPGLPASAVLVLYAVLRFATDFLRATDLPGSDTRFVGLTPAQFGALVLVGIGLVLGTRALQKKKHT